MENYQNIEITCADQYRLMGRFYPKQKTTQQNLPVLIAPATGITVNFYHAFAGWLSQQGFDVLSFDFRGIGKSLHTPLKDSTASITDWGQLDLPAAINTLLQRSDAKKIILLGHSAGGQLTGIIPNYNEIAKIITISGSSGHVKGLKGRTKILAPIMFKGIFPVARLVLGYGSTHAIGMGENLPKNVAKQWAEFCSRPGYVINAFGKTLNDDQNFHSKITQPITAIYSSDDEIATKTNVLDLLRLYPHAQTTLIELNTKDYPYKSIGHMSMFKHSHKEIWMIIKDQLYI